MKRARPFLAKGVLLVTVTLVGPFVTQATAAPVDGSRPNVVLIVTDDQGFGDMGRAGEVDCHDPLADPANCQHPLETALQAAGLDSFTPNLDRLSREGVRFSDFHATPVCATTRAALMTGRFNQRTGVLFPASDRQILSPDETTLAELFKNAGYRTAMFGKWNLGNNFPARPQDRGFDRVLKMGGASFGSASNYWQNDCFGDTYLDEGNNGISFGPNNDPPQPGDPHCTDIFFDQAKAFIADHVSQTPDQPFFAYIPTTAPHDLRTAVPFSFVPPNNPDPSLVYESLGVDPVLADFYGAIHGIDEQLGELRNLLQSLGLEDNTILVVFGDNGSQLTTANLLAYFSFLLEGYGINSFSPAYHDFTNPAGLRGLKTTLYDGGHRVFLFIRWPDGGITSENVQQIDALTHVSDLFPTLLDLAGIEVEMELEEGLDGISLESLLSGTPDDAFDQRTVPLQVDFGIEDPVTGASTPRRLFNFGVLTANWRLVHPGAGASRLYAASDRAQTRNLAPSAPLLVADLESRWGNYYDSWVGLYDDAEDRGRTFIGDPSARTQTLETSSWLSTEESWRGFAVVIQDGISTFENAQPTRGFWALKVVRAGDYSIKLRRWPSIDFAPASLANQAIDPRGGGSARLVISPEYFDLDGLSLTGSGPNRIDSTNSIGASDSESEFRVGLEEGEVFIGGELTGVSEFASGCDVNVDPDACPGVLRSPYFAVISFLGKTIEIDIKPGSCPNSWNRESNGVLPVAILGTEDFDVTQIDVSSVTISRADGTGGSVGPNEGPPGPHSEFEDVGTPFDGEEYDCHEAGGDGILDLSLKFKTRDVANLLPVDDPNGALVPLVVTGTLLDGTEFTSRSDCVRLVPPGSPPNQVTVQSIPGAWTDATPLDNTLEGGGFGSFKRSYPHTTVLTLTAPPGHNGIAFVGWKLDGGELVEEKSIALVVNNEEHTVQAVFGLGCGLGIELATLVPPLMWLHGRRKRTRP